jgi:hypothetical protein
MARQVRPEKMARNGNMLMNRKIKFTEQTFSLLLAV